MRVGMCVGLGVGEEKTKHYINTIRNIIAKLEIGVKQPLLLTLTVSQQWYEAL